MPESFTVGINECPQIGLEMAMSVRSVGRPASLSHCSTPWNPVGVWAITNEVEVAIIDGGGLWGGQQGEGQ